MATVERTIRIPLPVTACWIMASKTEFARLTVAGGDKVLLGNGTGLMLGNFCSRTRSSPNLQPRLSAHACNCDKNGDFGVL